jgi:hypothetical protein
MPAADALIAMPAECGRAATRDGAEHFELGPGERITIAFEELVACPADDIATSQGGRVMPDSRPAAFVKSVG